MSELLNREDVTLVDGNFVASNYDGVLGFSEQIVDEDFTDENSVKLKRQSAINRWLKEHIALGGGGDGTVTALTAEDIVAILRDGVVVEDPETGEVKVVVGGTSIELITTSDLGGDSKTVTDANAFSAAAALKLFLKNDAYKAPPTAEEVVAKYKGDLDDELSAAQSALSTAKDNAQSAIDNAKSDAVSAIDNAKSGATTVIEALVGSAEERLAAGDKKVTQWFVEGMANSPDNDTAWVNEEHAGDLLYDTVGLKGYVFKDVSGGHGVWQWVELAEDDATLAVLKIAASKDYTKDGERNVFYAEPKPPYAKGDLWVETGDDETTILRVCVSSRTEGAYDSDDWGEVLSDNLGELKTLQGDMDGMKWVNAHKTDIESIGRQSDRKAVLTFSNGAPKWPDYDKWQSYDECEEHIGDLYFDTEAKKAYVFSRGAKWQEPEDMQDSIDDQAYRWKQLDADDSTTVMLSKLAATEAALDGEISTFVTKGGDNPPTGPFHKGDIWIELDPIEDGVAKTGKVVYRRCQFGHEVFQWGLWTLTSATDYVETARQAMTQMLTGYLKSDDAAKMYAKVVDSNGRVVENAEIACVIGADGKARVEVEASEVTVSADNIMLDGSEVSINNVFKVNGDKVSADNLSVGHLSTKFLNISDAIKANKLVEMHVSYNVDSGQLPANGGTENMENGADRCFMLDGIDNLDATGNPDANVQDVFNDTGVSYDNDGNLVGGMIVLPCAVGKSKEEAESIIGTRVVLYNGMGVGSQGHRGLNSRVVCENGTAILGFTGRLPTLVEWRNGVMEFLALPCSNPAYNVIWSVVNYSGNEVIYDYEDAIRFDN